jgi:MYXO-CTERM domain-containing protein
VGSGNTEECFPCGTELCACDEGETPGSMPDQQEHKTDDPDNPDQGDPNPGPLALLVVLALLVWRFGR